MSASAGEILVIGLGNEHRRDDGAGLVAARALRARAPKGVRVLERGGEPTELVVAWDGAAAAILVDATAPRGRPGTIRRFAGGLPPAAGAELRCSTHGAGLPDAIALGRALGQIPDQLVVYSIEGRDFGHGQALSPEVARACHRAARRALEDALALLGG